MRNVVITSTLFLAALASVAAHAATVTFNAVSDFSTASNPNSVWGYGYGVAGTSYTADPLSGSNYRNGATNWDYWEYAATPDDLPVIAHNPGPGNSNYGPIVLPTDVLLLHPGDSDSTASILRFTAPDSGTYYLAGYFQRVDTSNDGNGVFVSIFDGSTPLLVPSLIAPSNHSQNSFTDYIYLTQGSTLDFAVARNGSYNDDSTGLSLQITETPEPSSIALFGTGMLGLVGAVRRRFKA